MRLQVSVVSPVLDPPPFSRLSFWDVLEVRNPDILQLHSNCIRFRLLPTWEARVSFRVPWVEVPQDQGSLAALREKHHQMQTGHLVE